MDIIAQLKAERDKTAQQVNALDTAIRALSGLNTTGSTRAAKDECRRTSENFCLTKSTLGANTRPESCFNGSQASHLSGRSSPHQSGN